MALSYWLPSLSEFVLFTVFIVVLIIIIFMIHYHLIQRKVRSESRCIREMEQYAKGSEYELIVSDKRNRDLYKLNYNFDTKQTTINCACPDGKVVNHFKSIPYYDIRNNESKTLDDYTCYCDKAYDEPGASAYYKGHPGLIRYYQNTKDTSFFNNDLESY